MDAPVWVQIRAQNTLRNIPRGISQRRSTGDFLFESLDILLIDRCNSLHSIRCFPYYPMACSGASRHRKVLFPDSWALLREI